jgi:hypothetical protein
MGKISLALIAIAVGSAACTSPPPPERDKVLGPKLAAATEHAFETNGVLKIDSLTTFPWERFYMFKPKQSPQQIDNTLGFHWATDYSDLTDTYCLFVFVLGKKVTHSLLFPRYQGDCVTIGVGPYDPQHAIFQVFSSGKTTGGQPFLRLVEAPQ